LKKANKWNRRSAICGKRRQRRGQIYLEDDEGVHWVVKKPFSLQSATAPKYKSPLSPVREVEVDEEKGERYHD
jgi:hypothetical protein